MKSGNIGLGAQELGQGVRWSTYEPEFGHRRDETEPGEGRRSVGWYLKWPSVATVLVLAVLAASAVLTSCTAPYIPPDVPPSKLDRIANVVARLSGLDPVDEYSVEFVSRSEIARLARELPEDPEELAEYFEDIRKFESLTKLLGLIPQNTDLRELFEQFESGILGLYDIDTGIIFVATDGPEFTVQTELTLVHEFVHLMQDAQFSLDALDEDVKHDTDAQAALDALVEGHAEYVETEYYWNELTSDQRDAYLPAYENRTLSEVRDFPEILGRTAIWPYDAGGKFVETLAGRFYRFEVHRIYLSLPETTEQIIDPAKYISNELILDEPPPEGLLRTVGDGWAVKYEGTLGPAFIRNWLESIVLVGDSSDDDILDRMAGDWARDDYVILERSTGELVLAAVIQWDRESDVGEFQRLLYKSYRESGRYEHLDPAETPFDMWSGPGGITGFVDLREIPSATFMVVGSTLGTVDQFLQRLTSRPVLSGDDREALTATPALPTRLPTPVPGPPTSELVPTERPVHLPTPTTVPELLPVDKTARIASIVIRLKLLGMISQDESDSESALVAEGNRPLLPGVRSMSFPFDLLPLLGEDWSFRVKGAAGVLFIQRWLESLGSDEGRDEGSALRAAQGWYTDAFLVLDGPDSQKGLIWRIDWNRNASDAAQMLTVLRQTLDRSPEFERLQTDDPEQILWKGPGGVLGFRNGNVLGWTSIVVMPDEQSVLIALRSLQYL